MDTVNEDEPRIFVRRKIMAWIEGFRMMCESLFCKFSGILQRAEKDAGCSIGRNGGDDSGEER